MSHEAYPLVRRMAKDKGNAADDPFSAAYWRVTETTVDIPFFCMVTP